MPAAHTRHSEIRAVLLSLSTRQRMSGLIRKMAHTIEVLDEDNRQLLAAVSVYREVIRRIAPGGVTPAGPRRLAR